MARELEVLETCLEVEVGYFVEMGVICGDGGVMWGWGCFVANRKLRKYEGQSLRLAPGTGCDMNPNTRLLPNTPALTLRTGAGTRPNQSSRMLPSRRYSRPNPNATQGLTLTRFKA